MNLHRLCFALVVTLCLSLAWAQEITFGYVEWPEAVMKTHVVSAVLQTLGYETEMLSLSVPLVLKGVSTGDLDVFLEAWFPSMGSMVNPYLEDGSIIMTARNLDGTLYRPAVPTYVYEMGVTSMADLAEHADEFDSAYYGIEPGNDGNEIMRRAIGKGTYNLSDWQLVESSEQGMLAAVERAIDQKEWIVFSGWRPHWMNNAYDIAYLDDPEGIWGEEGFVSTLVNSDYLEENPNLATFFEQFKVSVETQGEWIDQYGRQGRNPEEVAQEWIKANLDTVLGWVEGVIAASGEPAGPVLKATFGQ